MVFSLFCMFELYHWWLHACLHTLCDKWFCAFMLVFLDKWFCSYILTVCSIIDGLVHIRVQEMVLCLVGTCHGSVLAHRLYVPIQMFRCMCIHICSMTDNSTHVPWQMVLCLYIYMFHNRWFYKCMSVCICFPWQRVLCMCIKCIYFMIDELYVHYIYIYA
jgi:hypothetical protein